MIAAAFLLAACAGQLPAKQGDEEHVHDWLQKMVKAVHTLNYQGTFVYLYDNHMESMRIVHTTSEAGEREYLTSLNGVAREVVLDTASVTCISPDSKSILIGNRFAGKGFRAVFSMDIESLEPFYNFHMLGESRVADRPAKVVAIIPKDGFRYGYRIYLDRDNALPLKTDMMNATGDSVSQVMFTQLQIDSEIDDLEQFSIEGKEHYDWIQEKPMESLTDGETHPWHFTELPAGFDITLHNRASGGTDINHFVLSDGLASLSVYVERAAGESLQGRAQMGAVNAFGRKLNDYQVTVVGEVPGLTVERVASSLSVAAGKANQ